MLIKIYNPTWPLKELPMQYNHTLRGHIYSCSFHKMFLCDTYTHYDAITQKNCQYVVIKERKHVFITTWNPRWLPIWSSPLGKVIKFLQITRHSTWKFDFGVYSYNLGYKQSHRLHNILVEYDEKHNYAMDSKPSVMDYVNILIFWYFSQSSIFKVLSYTDAQEVNLYEYKPGMLMN